MTKACVQVRPGGEGRVSCKCIQKLTNPTYLYSTCCSGSVLASLIFTSMESWYHLFKRIKRTVPRPKEEMPLCKAGARFEHSIWLDNWYSTSQLTQHNIHNSFILVHPLPDLYTSLKTGDAMVLSTAVYTWVHMQVHIHKTRTHALHINIQVLVCICTNTHILL